MKRATIFNKTFTKGRLKELVSSTFQYYGSERALELMEHLKNLGFRLSTHVGISLGVEDLLTSIGKLWLTRVTERKVSRIKRCEKQGGVALIEYNHILVSAWIIASESLQSSVIETFQNEDPMNPVYLIAFSGARGNLTQIRQLIIIRGLIVDPRGRLVEYPIQKI
jgi:DNA-directed RNA polymerase subunit beta'